MANGGGLLQPKEAQRQVPAQGQGQGPGQISEQDQAKFDIFVSNGMSMIYDSKISKKLVDQILNAPDPIEAIAGVTLNVVERLEASAAKNKIKISDSVLIQGSNTLMAEIITLAETAGMKPLTDEQKYQAFSLAVSRYIQRGVKSGKITPEQLRQWGQEVSQTPQGQKIAQQMSGQGGPARVPVQPGKAPVTPAGRAPVRPVAPGRVPARQPAARPLLNRGVAQAPAGRVMPQRRPL